MANRGRPTLQKRQKERARQDKQKDRVTRREDAKLRRASAPDRTDTNDPDIADITPGPQPLPAWQAEFLEEESADKEEGEN
jgi:hypothetical protein|tara:strand:- start:1147 stop:1389 length:243 start_codon:yes stop_codon:yes gene_type:complete